MLWTFLLFLFGMGLLARQVADINDYFDGVMSKAQFVAHTFSNVVLFGCTILLMILL
jgi:hypothetical protein